MTIRGYSAGPIQAEAAFTSDFVMADDISVQQLVDMLEVERRSMDIRPGMRHKYMPLRFDPATGAHQVGGRYLFDTWDDVVDYERFTSQELEFEPGVKFWDRPFFIGVDRHIWRLIGAEDFTALNSSTHLVNRFERWIYRADDPAQALNRTWPQVRDAARRQGLSSLWLLHQPRERQIAILTVAGKTDGADPADAASRSLSTLANTESLGQFLPAVPGLDKVFDRTTLILMMWLPRSRLAGGEPSAFPASPPHPAPRAGGHVVKRPAR